MGKWDEKTTDMVSPTALNGFLCPTPWADFGDRRHLGRCEGVRGHSQPPLSCLGPDPPLVGAAGGFGVPGGGHAWVGRGRDTVPGGGHRRGAWDGAPSGRRAKRPCRLKKVFLLAKAAGAAEEEDLKAGGRCSGHATPLQPRSRVSVGIIFLREIELLLVPDDDTSSSGPSTA